MKEKKLIFKNISVMDEGYNVKSGKNVLVEEGIISYIGDDMPYGDEVYDGRGKILMSGFYNCHGHSPMTLMRGYGESMSLQDWLNKKIFPFEAKLTGDDVYWGTMLAMAESFQYGIVSTSDMYYFTEDMVRAIEDSGAKSNISRSVTNFTGDDFWDLEVAKEAKDAFERFHETCDGRVRIEMSLHGEYTSDPDTAKGLAEYTSEIGAAMHVHVSETRQEHEECKERHGKTPVAYLSECGIFDTPTTAAHCVWIEGDDYEILKEKGVSVAVNPISNMKLASGIAYVPALFRKGINVVIGTDSVASNNSLDFIEEMKVFAVASKVRNMDPTVVTPLETIRCATERGALCQGRADCGKVKEGYRADLIVLDIDQPHMIPAHDILNNIVYSASGSDVLLTMVDGKGVYRDGEYTTMDIEEVKARVKESTDRILRSL